MCRSKKSLCHFELVTCVRSSHYCCGSVVSNIPCLFFSCTLMFFVGMGGWILCSEVSTVSTNYFFEQHKKWHKNDRWMRQVKN